MPRAAVLSYTPDWADCRHQTGLMAPVPLSLPAGWSQAGPVQQRGIQSWTWTRAHLQQLSQLPAAQPMNYNPINDPPLAVYILDITYKQVI